MYILSVPPYPTFNLVFTKTHTECVYLSNRLKEKSISLSTADFKDLEAFSILSLLAYRNSGLNVDIQWLDSKDPKIKDEIQLAAYIL